MGKLSDYKSEILDENGKISTLEVEGGGEGWMGKASNCKSKALEL